MTVYMQMEIFFHKHFLCLKYDPRNRIKRQCTCSFRIPTEKQLKTSKQSQVFQLKQKDHTISRCSILAIGERRTSPSCHHVYKLKTPFTNVCQFFKKRNKNFFTIHVTLLALLDHGFGPSQKVNQEHT